MRRAAAVLFALGTLCLAAPVARGQPVPPIAVLYARLDEMTITPVIERFLAAGVEQAARDSRRAFLVELDTPGGLDTSMRAIVETFLRSPVPVIVFVPQGARAASAGAIIGFSAHVLAMAPAASIGAATPVAGETGADLERKIVNEAASFAEAVARERGRNVAFARETVRQGRSASAEEALEIGAIDLIARDAGEVLDAVDGRMVTTTTGRVTMQTADARLIDYDLNLLQRARQRLANPNLAFLFLSLGLLALMVELSHPGLAGPGTAGVILVLLGLFGISALPVNAVGALLLLLSLGLFIAEVFTPGFGAFGAGGSAALLFGGLFLFEETLEVSRAVVVPVALAVGGGVVLAGRIAMRVRTKPSITGTDALIGSSAAVKRVAGDVAQVFVAGAWWRVRSAEPLAVGTPVRIVGVEGLDLIVEVVQEERT